MLRQLTKTEKRLSLEKGLEREEHCVTKAIAVLKGYKNASHYKKTRFYSKKREFSRENANVSVKTRFSDGANRDSPRSFFLRNRDFS